MVEERIGEIQFWDSVEPYLEEREVRMPINKVPRYKLIKCRTCGKTIRRFDRTKYPGHHVPAGEVLRYIRRHYKKHHPGKFRESIRRGVRKRAQAG